MRLPSPIPPTFLELTAFAGAAGWIALLLLPWHPWSTRERLPPTTPGDAGSSLDGVTVLIPARNEADRIGRTLEALRQQGTALRVVLVDDQSSDGTVETAEAVGLENLTVVRGVKPPEGWSGKLWALHQGTLAVRTPWLLLLDADIALAPGMVGALLQKATQDGLDLVSVMADLRTQTAWERLLAPAFVYFFKLLYPFALGNRPGSPMAVAAGGCLLLRTATLGQTGGFSAIRDALIDDCALAKRVKAAGGRAWVGLSHGVVSHRPYDALSDFWNMVARTAYTQLRYSPALLGLTTAGMLTLFGAPALAAVFGRRRARLVGSIGLSAMAASYVPTLRWYGLPPWRALTLPWAAFLYLLMTWSSAVSYARGDRSRWKGRVYAAPAGPAKRGPAGAASG